MRLLTALALLLLLPHVAVAQAEDSPDRRASYVQGSIRATLTYLAAADSVALAAGDTAASRLIRQARGRVRATETHTLILRVLLRDTVALPPDTLPVDTLPAPDDPPPVVIEEPDADPTDAPPPAPFDTTAPRLFVVEDIRATGNLVTLKFRPGWEQHDSIRATTTAGTLTRSGLTWTLDSSSSALVTVKVYRTMLDGVGALKTAQPVYYAWVQADPPREVTIPAAIDATGVNDVCSATDNQMEAWLATVPNGAVIRGADGARYRCDYGLSLVNRWNLSFTGAVTLFTDYDAEQSTDIGRRQFRLFEVERGGDIAFDGWTFQGPRAAGDLTYKASKETQHGLEFNGTNGVTLNRVTVRNVYGDFVNISFSNSKWGDGLFASEPTRHLEIANSVFENAGRQGIAMTGLYDGRIHSSTFANVQRSLWDFEPGGTAEWVQDVSVCSNRITGRIRNNVVAGHGSGRWVQNITICDNDLGPKGFRMHFGGNVYRRGLRILRNTAHVELGSSDSPIEVKGWSDVEIAGNTILLEERRRKPAVLLTEMRGDFTIHDNTYPGGRVELEVVP